MVRILCHHARLGVCRGHRRRCGRRRRRPRPRVVARAGHHPRRLPLLLWFLYTLDEASVLDAACLSQRYLAADLRSQCVEFCAANVSLTNAVPWLIAADAHAIAGLREPLLEFVAANLPGFKAAVPDTQAVLRGHPDLMFAMLEASAPATPPAAKRRKTRS